MKIKGFCFQQEQSDCGVACLLSIIKFHKGHNTIGRLRELSGTTKQGTTLLGLYQAATNLGFDSQGLEADTDFLISSKTPTILHVMIDGYLQHYLVCYGYQDNKFIIGNPAKGITYYSRNELNKVWESKTCLTLIPNNDFNQVDKIKEHKKQWFIDLIKDDFKLLLFSVLLGLAIAILGMVMAIFSQKLIDDILPSNNIMKLVTGLVLVTIFLALRIGITSLRDYFLILQTKEFNSRINDSFYGSLLNLPKSFFDTRKIGELVARLNDTQRIQRVIRMVVSNSVINVLIIIVSLIFILSYSWQICLILVFSLPMYFLLIYRFNRRIISAQKDVMQNYALTESNYVMSMNGIATIKNNNKQTIFKTNNKLLYSKYQNTIYNLGKINIKLSVYSSVFNLLFSVIIISYASFKVFEQSMLLGELMAILGITATLLPSVSSLALIALPINEAKVAFNRMYEFASLDSEHNGVKSIEQFKTLRIKNLSFRFKGRSQLLKKINLEVSKKECIAIIGESGCGKSTLNQVIQKFYGYENGEILINGSYKLNQILTKEWRKLIGVVSQEITVFNGSYLDNILLGAKDEPAEVVKFCKKNEIEQFILELPQGYSTIIGEEGVNLSGGQKKLLALIRALYKKPQLLILDELSAGMDRRTEKFVIELLKGLKKNMSIIFISHRISTLKNIADRIYIIENGSSDIYGSHDTLLKNDNFYSQFWKELNS